LQKALASGAVLQLSPGFIVIGAHNTNQSFDHIATREAGVAMKEQKFLTVPHSTIVALYLPSWIRL
jgi:hypothetical protein